MSEHEKRDERAEEAELRRQDEEVKDLEPDEEQGDDVKGGYIKMQAPQE